MSTEEKKILEIELKLTKEQINSKIIEGQRYSKSAEEGGLDANEKKRLQTIADNINTTVNKLLDKEALLQAKIQSIFYFMN